MKTGKLSATIPAATMAQRMASMSETELMNTARALAQRTDAASDKACTAVLETLERRVPGASFEAFVSEIFA